MRRSIGRLFFYPPRPDIGKTAPGLARLSWRAALGRQCTPPILFPHVPYSQQHRPAGGLNNRDGCVRARTGGEHKFAALNPEHFLPRFGFPTHEVKAWRCHDCGYVVTDPPNGPPECEISSYVLLIVLGQTLGGFSYPIHGKIMGHGQK